MKSRFPRRAASLFLAFVLAFSLVLPAAADDITGLKITASANRLAPGQTLELTLDGYNFTAENVEDVDVIWKSDHGSISVPTNATGTSCTVTANTVDAETTANVTAQVSVTLTIPDESNPDVTTTRTDTATATYAITVTPPPSVIEVSSVTISPATETLTLGVNGENSKNLAVNISPESARNLPVTWRSDNERIVTVDQTGAITAQSPGKATISATVGGKSGYCNVEVLATPVITIAPQGLDLAVGGTGKLSATLPRGTGRIHWEIPQDGIVELYNSYATDKEITLLGRKEGTCTVTVRDDNNSRITGVCVVRVTTPDTNRVTGVKITRPDILYLDQNGTVDLTAVVSPATATPTLRWSTSSNGIATVTPKEDTKQATVRGIAPGTVRITVSTDDGRYSDYIELDVSGVTLEKHALSLFVNKSETLVYHLYGSVKSATPSWKASNPSIADAATSGRVTGHYPGTTDIVISAGKYTDTCTVTVSEDLAQAIERNLGSKASFSFADIMTELNQRSQDKNGYPLSEVYGLQVSTKNGILYYGYISPDSPGHGVGGTERYYVSPGQGQMALRDITFVPKAGYTGTAVIDYTGVDTQGVPFLGTIRITMTSTGDVAYSTASNRPLAFSAGDFSAVCQTRNGKAIRYVTFEQPPSTRGTLYYNYSPTGQYSQKVDSATLYYPSSSPSISSITFVPAENYIGTVNVTYHCMDSSGSSYTGNVSITVYAPTGSDTANVEYTTGMGDRITLNATDFQTVCRNLTGNNLDYIRFDSLPNTTNGVLYYNYSNSNSTRVNTTTSYYRNSTPRISYISFVPANNYTGTITVPFTGYTTVSSTFKGNLVIRVGDDVSGTITYRTAVNQPVTFTASDFNSACQSSNGAAMNRVSFTLPPSSSGVLYYNYVAALSTGTRVSTTESYYRSGSPSLSSVTFVPANNYNGTVSIPFNGYDVNGGRFSGTVRITVGSGDGNQAVTYSTVTGGAVRFSAADFNTACRAITGDTLNYLRFDLPSSRYGTLYYQYNTSSRTGTALTSSTNYYRTGSSGSRRLLDDVTFVAGSVTGTTTIHYTGTNSNGETYSGNVQISVRTSSANVILYNGSSAPISFRAADFQNACESALGNPLSYVQFSSLPSSGLLSTGYLNPSQTGTPVSTGTRYYPSGSPEIGQITYRPKAETQGIITIPFTGYDTNGGSFTSTVQISLSNSYTTTPFTDLAYGWDWAKPSIEFLRQSGITNGYGNNQFGPGRQISRGEFTLMICRAFQFQTNAGTASFPDVPSTSVYAGAVAAARNLGIVQGENGLFKPNNPITRQSAMTMICRAIQAAGQSLPTAPTTLLSAYSDGGQVSAFARSSVAALIQLGAVRGTTDMRINPRAAISRAEMAVILHRVLTR